MDVRPLAEIHLQLNKDCLQFSIYSVLTFAKLEFLNSLGWASTVFGSVRVDMVSTEGRRLKISESDSIRASFA